ncbi:hypothetical protein [Membranihabitans maritimus]|uniref:hypothetical protein n=1 Tax=Membranihabitans maritimus TaxID=2904244 RepID=UPI001F21B14A|nr:hypothetical protein [Membranihabitans maritimus]
MKSINLYIISICLLITISCNNSNNGNDNQNGLFNHEDRERDPMDDTAAWNNGDSPSAQRTPNNGLSNMSRNQQRDWATMYRVLGMTDDQIKRFEQSNLDYRQQLDEKVDTLAMEKQEEKVLKSILSPGQYNSYLKWKEEHSPD